MTPEAEELVRKHGLEPHPEGGYFRETFRSPDLVPGNRPGTVRNSSTVILFLVPEGACSRLHRLDSDEEWILRSGGPLEIIEMAPEGPANRSILGVPAESRHTVRAGTWFGARVTGKGSYALAECRVSPGFDFSDFEMGTRERMLAMYPHEAETVKSLT